MTDEERKEALVLSRQVFDREYISNFLAHHQTSRLSVLSDP
jgi:uncharacterized protein (DUF305 family)